MHDPRVGRFFARDPLSGKFPWNSPYAFSENRVIDGLELEGLEVVHFGIPGKVFGTIDFKKMDEKTIKIKIAEYEKFHKGRMNFDYMRTRNDNEVWTIESLQNPYGYSTGVKRQAYASDKSYKNGEGKPFYSDTDRTLLEGFTAKDSELDSDWKKGMSFGVNAIAAIFSGGSLVEAKAGVQTVWAVTGLLFTTEDLTNLDGKTALENKIAKKYGEKWGNRYNNCKVAFYLIDAEKSLYEFSLTLQDGTKIEKTFNALNNIVIRVNTIVNPPEVKKDSSKKDKDGE
jgi:hypothetical protein